MDKIREDNDVGEMINMYSMLFHIKFEKNSVGAVWSTTVQKRSVSPSHTYH